MSSSATAPLIVLILLLGVVWWVHSDATAHARAWRPVVFQAGNLVIDSPAGWAMVCLALSVLGFPLYLACRRAVDG